MSQSFFYVVAFGAYRVGLEVLSAAPDHAYFAGWLRDEVARRKGAGSAAAEAQWLAGRVADSFPGRRYFAEVQRGDRLGQVRVEGTAPSLEAIKQ